MLEEAVNMVENIIVVIILLLLIGGAVAYLIKAKRSGVKCIGCPAGGSCPASQKVKRKKLSGKVTEKKEVVIKGMHCAHCVKLVTESLNEIDGVSAKVDLSSGKATAFCDRQIDNDVIKKAVEQAGFICCEIENI